MPDQQDRTGSSRRWIALGVAGVLLVVVGGIVGWQYLDNRDARNRQLEQERRHRCDGLDATSGPGFQLHKTDDGHHQCIGWTIDRTVTFGATEQRVLDLVGRMVEENTRVRDNAAQYVRVGVMLPMPADSDKPALFPDTAYHSLQGAYAAQLQANTASALRDTALQIQLVLVNEGARQEHWSDDAVVPALGRLKDDPEHPLVAVTGMGISKPETVQAATALHNLGLPVIGSVLTADDMVAPDLFKVSPSNHHYARALQEFLAAQPALPNSWLPSPYTGYLVFDRDPTDNFVQSLYAAIMDTFGTDLALADRSRGFDGSLATNTTVFERHTADICTLKPDVIFYAGRSRDLQTLVEALGLRSRCTEGEVKPLLIATGTTGLNNLSSVTLEEAQVGILDASSTDPQGWRTSHPNTPPDYPAFHTLFTDTSSPNLSYPESDLDDGYAIMQRDAVAAAVSAARWYFSAQVAAKIDRTGPTQPNVSPVPTANDVRNSLYSINTDPLPGASGRFYFREKPQNDLWPIDKPVPVIRLGSVATSLPAVTRPYLTHCQIRSHPDQPTNYQTQDCHD